MKKVFYSIIFLGILGGITGYLIYGNFLNSKKTDNWSLVPGNAIMVYESNNFYQAWDSIQSKTLWENLTKIPFIKKVTNNYAKIDSLSKGNPDLKSILANNNFLISWHATSNTAFDCAFYFKMKNPKHQQKVIKVLENFEKNDQYRYQTRKYNGIFIREIAKKNGQKQFSYIFYEGHFIGSFTPYLVEDVIRNLNEQESSNFKEKVKNLFPVSRFKNDEGNLFINFEKMPLFIATFLKEKNVAQLSYIAQFCQAAFLDVKVSDDQLLLSGFSVIPNENSGIKTYLGTFENQDPGKINMEGLIPETTALFYHLHFSNPLRWQKNISNYHHKLDQEENTYFSQNKRILNEHYDTPPSAFYSWFDGNIGLSVLETINRENPDQLLIIRTSDTAQAQKTLTNFSQKIAQEQDKINYSEKFGGYTIREIQFENLPATLLGRPFTGFPECYYTFIGNDLVIANSIRGMKRLIKDREEENTWGKSVNQNLFLENNTGKANFSIIINTPRVWNMLMENLAPKWQQIGQNNAPVFKNFDKATFQFSKSEGQYYTSATISHNPMDIPEGPAGTFEVLKNTNFSYPVTSKPRVVRNHENQNKEIITQDSLNYLSLIGNNGRILWRDSLEAPLVSKIYQIDYYKNGKLQYLLATPGALHIIDRKGRYIEGFPMELPPDVTVDHLSLIDYDNSKNYRFLVADQNGDLYMYNKEGKNLNGWQPRPIENSLAIPPWHIRIRGKDCLIAVTEKGVVHVIQRNGKYYEGFPIDLKSTTHSPFFIQQGSNFSKTTFTSVTDNGEIIAFNLEGEIIKREQLYRPSKNTEFRLIPDELGKTFVIARKGLHALTMLNNQGRVIFEKNYFSRSALESNDLQVQYYNFGAGKELFAVTDGVQDFTYLFNEQGNLFNNRPIESNFKIGLIYYEHSNAYHIYRSFENQVSVLKYDG